MSNAPYRARVSLTCEDVGCDRGDRPVVRGVSFSLAPGGGLQIFGRNGAGKSSLLSVLSGRTRPASGQVSWSLGDASAPAPTTSLLSVLDHAGAVKPTLSVTENLAFWRSLYGATKTAAAAALDELGLSRLAGRPAFTLSAGERRRLAFARLWMSDRPAWILDEPTTSVDAAGSSLVADIISRHLARGGLAVVATHHKLEISGDELALG